MGKEIALGECLHGIPLVNGMGCMICSNRTPSNTVCVNLEKGTRETRVIQVLRSLDGDLVMELPAHQFI